MALDESAVADLIDALAVGDGTDLVRELARWALQELIELEAAETIGADRWERSPDRVTHRNGHRRRVLSTKAGDLEVGIPKLRKGSFFPEILEPRRRIDQALYAVVMEAYVNGVSTRAVDDLVVAMGIDTGISESEVSRICAGLDEKVAAFRDRTLGHVAFPYVYFMTEDEVSRGDIHNSPLTGEPFDAVPGPSCVESVITSVDGNLWKLNRYYDADARTDERDWELRGLSADPGERENRYQQPNTPGAVLEDLLAEERLLKRLTPVAGH